MSLPAVSICVCTFHRPIGLSRLLQSLRNLDPSGPSYEVIVVDNDTHESARPVVRQAQAEGMVIRYFVETVQSIALARSRAVGEAAAEWVAFIDDDEEADPRWLVKLWEKTRMEGVDGVFGSIKRRFERGTREWIRNSYPTLERANGYIRWNDTATGNALVRRSAMLSTGCLFNPAYGRTGGEDTELFKRMVEAGSRFVGVSSSIVYESLPASRTTIRYLLRWWFSNGITFSEIDMAGVNIWQLNPRFSRRLWVVCCLSLIGLYELGFSPERGSRRLQKACFEAGILFGKLTGMRLKRTKAKDDVPLQVEL